MHLDVQDLRNFYYRSTLGRAAQAAIRTRVLEFWPESGCKGQTVAGFGFAVPLLRPYLADARRMIALMPGPQGVMPWPAGMPNVSVLTEETMWPVDTGRVDRLLVMHGLETSERPSRLLQECWRALGPGGRVLFIVPNRAGLWSRSDATPFGYGQPYTAGQLEAQLRRHDFFPEGHGSALYQPPSSRRFWLRAGPLFERVGRRMPTVLAGGVVLVEAVKRVQPRGKRIVKERETRPVRAPAGLAEPV
ncbi:methyltransferase domain-containing protein [Pukyongiella litopenaei]|uniref:Class I SAM-dependent methyltransferase n=1 Tax=Pukyongiella litopenaei TaxID=2605946 RepID=A0A2S0MLW8_9RHOB|nr:methyltransferase domain-containing protein [Pukyongiella litopenaei]AVO36878.1 class I SAM-dependent methyltransferase [Pukyongiella litopenaei]